MSDFQYKLLSFISHRNGKMNKNWPLLVIISFISFMNFFIKISMNLFCKYVIVSVAAKMSVQFRSTTSKISKNRSEFTKSAIFYLFWFLVHMKPSTVSLMDGFYWKYLDASKMLWFFKIGAMLTFCQSFWVKVKGPTWWNWYLNFGTNPNFKISVHL